MPLTHLRCTNIEGVAFSSQGNLSAAHFLLIFNLVRVKNDLPLRKNSLAKRKKHKRNLPPSLLSPEEQGILDGFIGNPKSLLPEKIGEQIPSPRLAEALVENLPLDDPATLQILKAIGNAFPQKPVQKAVKKKLFQLRQRGIILPDLEPETGPAFPLTKEEPTAFIGPIDGAGNRPLFIAIPQRASGIDLAMGAVNDEKGILEFILGRYSRKRTKELKDLFFSKVPHMVETTLSHVTTTLEHAYGQEKENPGEAACEYLRIRPWLLENTRLMDRSPASDHVSMAGVSRDMLTESRIQKLLHHELMASWLVDFERLRPLVEEIQRTEESPIFISEAQRREHLMKVKGDGIAKIFGGKERETLRDRLQEMADVFLKIGEEPLARLCLAASLSLGEEDSLLRLNPFLRALVERSLDRLRKPSRPSSPILL